MNPRKKGLQPRRVMSARHAPDPLLADLAQPVEAPDLTRSIMGRLGYMRVSPRVARRRRVMRWASRAGMTLTMGVALTIAARLYESSPQARRPDGLTVPAALGEDLKHQQDRFGRMIHTIRMLSPRIEPAAEGNAPADAFEPAERIEHDALPVPSAPFRWV